MLAHPRCMNCHSAGDFPRQGDDSHQHTMQIRRGQDGQGAMLSRVRSCRKTLTWTTIPGISHRSSPVYPSRQRMVQRGRNSSGSPRWPFGISVTQPGLWPLQLLSRTPDGNCLLPRNGGCRQEAGLCPANHHCLPPLANDIGR